MTNKLAATKQAIVLLVDASGPVEYSDIVREVKHQAYMCMLPKAMHELLTSNYIVYNEEHNVYNTVN